MKGFLGTGNSRCKGPEVGLLGVVAEQQLAMNEGEGSPER